MDSLSDKNPLIKELRKAASRGTLTDDGYAIAEGPHLIEEAMTAGCEIKLVFVAEGTAENLENVLGSEGSKLPLRTVSDKTFREIASTGTPQGVVALVKPPVWTMTDLMQVPLPLLVVLDGIQEPGNAGAIVRATEAFGATGAVFLKGTVNPYNPKCMRASAGSLFRLPIVSGVDVAGLPEIVLYAAMPRATISVEAADFRKACAVVIGGEGAGVRPELASRAAAIRIPTTGVESLNAAVAAGVLLYEANRQRRSSEVKAEIKAGKTAGRTK